MPVCHGAGGMTAHFRLGARTGGAAVLIGIPLVAMALFLDGNVVPIFGLIPHAVLGVLVVFVGAQHSLFVRDLKKRREIAVALAVAVTGVLVSNLAIGLASGIALHLALQTASRGNKVWSRLLAVVGREA
jgi:sulfate permease, SulP family